METQPRSISVHIPVAFLALSLSVFFWSQIGAASRTVETINWQLENIDKALTQVKDGQKQLAEAIEKGKPVLANAQAVQENYTKLLNDVLDLAKDDADARLVTEKWKIQRSEPAPDAAKPAGDAKPAEPKKP